jgi:hypothetical protein
MLRVATYTTSLRTESSGPPKHPTVATYPSIRQTVDKIVAVVYQMRQRDSVRAFPMSDPSPVILR